MVDSTELIQAISHRADVFARGEGFTVEFEVMFEQLIAWAAGKAAVDNGNCRATGAVVVVSQDNEALSWFTHIMSS